jgi:hypothetical protein
MGGSFLAMPHMFSCGSVLIGSFHHKIRHRHVNKNLRQPLLLFRPFHPGFRFVRGAILDLPAVSQHPDLSQNCDSLAFLLELLFENLKSLCFASLPGPCASKAPRGYEYFIA